MVSLMCARISRRNRSPASAKSDDRTTAVLSALASRLTAASARSLSFQTCAAMNATNRPKTIPSGGHARRDGFEGPRSSACRQPAHREIDSRCHQIGRAEHHQRHPHHGQRMQPIAHDNVPAVRAAVLSPALNVKTRSRLQSSGRAGSVREESRRTPGLAIRRGSARLLPLMESETGMDRVRSQRERAQMGSANRLKLCLFGANCSSGRAVTMVPERWSGSWPDCVALAKMADEAGIEFMLPIGRWKGYGGVTDYQGETFETVSWAAGLHASTQRLVVFGTVHAPLIAPLIAAKEFVTA